MILTIISASIITGILYRMGGSGNYPRQARVIGIPLIATLCSLFFVQWSWWAYLLSFGLMVGAISTYWDWIWKNEDNFWLHGLMLGLAFFPMAIISGHWLGFGIRAIILCVFMGVWDLVWNKDVIEEFGRGFAIIITLFWLGI